MRSLCKKQARYRLQIDRIAEQIARIDAAKSIRISIDKCTLTVSTQHAKAIKSLLEAEVLKLEARLKEATRRIDAHQQLVLDHRWKTYIAGKKNWGNQEQA